MDRESALKRIRKCLALAESDEPHEAAAALRHARALMDKFHVTESEAALSDITESSCLSSGKRAAPACAASLRDGKRRRPAITQRGSPHAAQRTTGKPVAPSPRIPLRCAMD